MAEQALAAAAALLGHFSGCIVDPHKCIWRCWPCALQALLCLKCLQQVVHLLGAAAAPVMRLEGGLRALLAVLQQPGIELAAGGMAAHLLAQLAAGSSTTLNAIVDGVSTTAQDLYGLPQRLVWMLITS
jgi:hypothetical protein